MSSLSLPPPSSTPAAMFGQLIIGPPGSGKTTYCHQMSHYLKAKYGSGNVKIVNLDPGNDALPYDADVDISELVSLDDVMDRLELGPNGALIYSMEFIQQNFESFVLSPLTQREGVNPKEPCWVLFDMPGQVELYTHQESIKSIVKKVEKIMTLCTLNLIDSHYCSDPGKYISCLLTSLTMMLHISTPHLNVLSKIDLVEKYGKLPFNLDFYTEVLDLDYLVDVLGEDKRLEKYKSLNRALASLVENYSLVSFQPLDVQNEALVGRLADLIDKAVGRVFSI